MRASQIEDAREERYVVIKLGTAPHEDTSRPAAVVLGVDDALGLGLIRNLGVHGVPVFAVDARRRAIGFASRYGIAQRVTDLRRDEVGFVRDLIAIRRGLSAPPVLLTGDEEYLDVVARNLDVLAEHFAIRMCPSSTMERLADKEEQLLAAQRAGVPAPVAVRIAGPDDLRRAADLVPFPALLKPVTPLERLRLMKLAGAKAVPVRDPAQLREKHEAIKACGTLMLQELIPGDDDQILLAGAYHDARSRPLAVFTGRKLRQHPRGFGNTRAGESLWDQEVADLMLRLLAEFQYQGISDVEFKRDARDGSLKLMEINARQGLWATLATAAGVNLTYTAYRDAIGSPVTAPPQRDGVGWVDSIHDVPDSLREVRRDEMRPGDWFASLAGVRADAVLSLRDPAPAAMEVVRVAWAHLPNRWTGRA
jgi:predicted ATP-grasp superfamily ATP-dependent carboligase